MPVSARHAEKRLSLGSLFELDLLKKEIGHQSPQPRIFELEFSNSVATAARLTRLTRFVCRLSPRRCLAPPVQGHDTHTERARNVALQFPSRRQFICLRQLRRDFRP